MPGNYDPETLPIGVLGRAHGLRGELTLRPHNVSGGELGGLKELILERQGGRDLRPLESIRRGGDGWLVKLAGVNSRTEAEALTNVAVRVHRAALPPLGAGEFFVADAVGCDVVTDGGRSLGTVTEVFWNGAHDVLLVKGERELLIPAVGQFIRAVDAGGRKVTVAWDEEEEVAADE